MTHDETSLSELARMFLRLGTIGFGGPAAHIAMMENEVVRRRRWLTREQFLDYLGATNLIPGPNSTELAIHIGYARAGWPGLIVAGLSFIIPAVFIVTAVAWVDAKYGTLPDAAGILYGIKPVVIAIVGQALWNLGRSAMKTKGLMGLAAAAVAALAAGADELLVLVSAGVTWALGSILQRSRRPAATALAVAAGGASSGYVTLAAAAVSAGTGTAAFGLWTIFLLFAKIGSVLFGSGYVLLAFLRADFVERLGWLTEQQLIDATAVGQMTPGPVFTTATFIGYILSGPVGAAVATVGIFLPAFAFVALSGPMVPRLRRSAAAAAALEGVNVASLALMAVVAWHLGRVALVDPIATAIAVLSLLAVVHYRVNSAWLIAAGGLLGWMAVRWI